MTVTSLLNSHPRRSALNPIVEKLSAACHRFLSSLETHTQIESSNKKLPRRCEGARVERESRGNITCCSELGLKHSADRSGLALAPALPVNACVARWKGFYSVRWKYIVKERCFYAARRGGMFPAALCATFFCQRAHST